MKLFEGTIVDRVVSRIRRLSKEQNQSERRKGRLLAHLGIDLAIDVGANRGQYGRHLRMLGYKGNIVSLEPGREAYGHLVATASGDPSWTTRRMALGAQRETRTFHIAGNIGMSSSFLEMLPASVAAAPNSAYVGAEEAEIVPLDAVFSELRGNASRVFLKLDVQGMEAAVLDGAAASLDSIELLELESSLVPLYRGECLLPEMMERLHARAFTLVGLNGGFEDHRTGQMLQVDALFARGERFAKALSAR
jgi:FkbM family methyltransferase